MDGDIGNVRSDKKIMKKLKEQIKAELKAELRQELEVELKEGLKAEYWIRRSELVEIVGQLLELLCAEFDGTAQPKVDRCLQKLRQIVALDSDEAVDIVNKWRKENENSYKKKVIEELCEQLMERERRSKNRWMAKIGNLKHYVVELDDGQEKFLIANDLLNRFKDRLVILFMKVNDEVEDLLCSLHRRERYQMVEYLLPGLTRRNAIANVMGGNVRITFAKNDEAYEYHGKPGEPLVIINYDFYTRTKTYMHRLRLAGFNGLLRGIVINLVEQSELVYLGNLECHYDIVMEPLLEESVYF